MLIRCIQLLKNFKSLESSRTEKAAKAGKHDTERTHNGPKRKRVCVEGVLLRSKHTHTVRDWSAQTAKLRFSHAHARRELECFGSNVVPSRSPLLRLGRASLPLLLGQYCVCVSSLKGTDPTGGFFTARAKKFVCFPSRFRVLDYCVCVSVCVRVFVYVFEIV